MKAALLFCLLAVPGFATGANANGPNDLGAADAFFRDGNAAYDQGRFAEAAEAYGKAVAAGAADARLFYNQGNALFRLDRLGEAILAYERARKLAPGDEDIAYNLRFAQSRTVDKLPETPDNALTRFLWSLHSGYSLRAGVWIAFALWTLGFLALGAWLFARRELRLVAAIAGAIAFGGLLLFAPSLLYRAKQYESEARAVVITPVAEVFSGPGENQELLFRVHEGTVLRITGKRGEWIGVKLPDGRGGFVRSDKTGEV